MAKAMLSKWKEPDSVEEVEARRLPFEEKRVTRAPEMAEAEGSKIVPERVREEAD